MPRHAIDLTGKVFGRLTVIRREANDPSGHSRWACKCKCGGQKIATGSSMIHGETKSCGCLKIETSIENLKAIENPGKQCITHGMSYSPTWRIWQGMISRCYCPTNSAYPSYGGRGITVCQRWRESFENFFNDMGTRPEGLQIERKDNRKGYTPDNCKWATRKEQCRNKRNNRKLTLNGITRLLIQWAEETGIPMKYIHKRLDRGWTIRRALTQPVKTLGLHKRAHSTLG